VRVDTKEKSLKLFEDDKLLAAFPVTPGSERLPAPVGSWKIESIVMLPIFRWDPKMLNEGERSSAGINLPPGPRNPVGIVWMQLNTKGIGIHGTDDPAGIGRTSSHGCIRLANWDAAKLARMVTAGCAVEIQ
jgi:lipoprotein-anchoring transpeptidase ErfK/SrfK